MSADGTITIYTQVDNSGIEKGLNSINHAINKFGNAIKGIIGVAGIATLTKQAIEMSSQLTEYTNVAEQSFGELKGKLDAFTQTSIQNFGMSRLTAIKAASAFEAMGNSIGFSKQKATEMSLTLTGLVGDFASFYNISQEEAKHAVSAVYTGEVKTLKQYGIMLTQANLQEYENTKGKRRSVAEMTAQEKALLRYNYVMEATKQLQGDFVRTQDTWANQVRVLIENIKELGVAIGGGLITVFKPLVMWINQAISSVMSFINVIGSTLGKLLGFSVEVRQIKPEYADLAAGAEDAAGAQDDLADSTDDAAKAAKGALASFDQLNVIQNDNDSSKKGKGGSGGGGGDASDAMRTGSMYETIIKKAESDLNSFYELGNYVNNALETMLKNIPWSKIFAGAMNFGINLADFLNGLISPELFYTVGNTIARALDTAIYATLTFGKTFDWSNFGLSLAAGVNGFFQNFDFGSLAKDINNWVQGLYTTLTTALNNVSWSDVYNGVKTFLSKLDIKTIAIIIGAVTIKDIGTFIFSGKAFALFSSAITKLITDSFSGSAIGGAFKEAGVSGAIEKAFSEAIQGASAIGTNATTLISGFFSSLPGVISGAFSSLLNLPSTIFTAFQGLFATDLPSLLTTFTGFLEGSMSTIITALTSPLAVFTYIIAGIAMVIVAIIDLWNNSETFRDNIKSILDNIISMVKSFWDNVLKPIIDAIIEILKSLWDNVLLPLYEVVKTIVAGVIAVIAKLFDKFKPVFDFIIDILKVVLPPILTALKIVFEAIFKAIGVSLKVFNIVFKNVFDALGDIIDTFADIVGGVIDGIKRIFGGIIEFITGVFTGDWSRAWQGIQDIFGGIWDGVVALAKGGINLVIDLINGMIGAVQDGLNWVIGGLNNVGFDLPDWLGGGHFGIDLGYVSFGRIPQLATGAVIPPNKKFMAVLGDQTNGNNIEAPEDLIRAIIREEMGNGSAEELGLMKEQNALLKGILRKTGITKSDVGKNAVEYINDETARTGNTPILI